VRVKYENVRALLNEWRNHYIAITTTAVAETFLNKSYSNKVYYRCRNCGRKVLRTKEVVKLTSKLSNALKQLIKTKCTNFIVFDKGLLVCSRCYHKEKERIKQYERLGHKKVAFELLKQISLECIQTREYKKTVAKAYRLLENLKREGFFKYKQKNGRQNLYYFKELPLKEFGSDLF